MTNVRRFSGCRFLPWAVVGCCLLAPSPCAWARQSVEPAEGDGVAVTRTADEASPTRDDPATPAEPREVNFDDLKFDIAIGAEFKETMLTEAIKKLDGAKVRIRGFVRPGFKQSGIKNFVLVRDNQECCFGPGAALYDCVMVKMAADQSIDFTVRPICVVGTLQIKKYVGKDGKVWAIYRLNDTRQE